jgi:hypothetical protein
MKQMLTAEELVSYLDKKTAELEGAIMINEIYPLDANKANKQDIFDCGVKIGKLQGQRDVLMELALLLKF